MNLHIRPPLTHEWPICRMLLPETFIDVASREYLLCLRDEHPRIVAAVSFRRTRDAATQLRLHVVSSFRRRRVGSRIVSYLARSGSETIEGTADITKEPGAEAFCRRNGLLRNDGLTTVEADMAGMRQNMGRMRDRIATPPNAHVIPLNAAPVNEVASLHARYVAHEGSMDPWRFIVANTANMVQSPVVILDGRVVGLMLWELNGQMVHVHSRLVLPAYQRSWVNVILLAAGLDGAWAGGARRVRFSYTDSNHDTEKLAARFKAEVVSVVTKFERRVMS